MKVASYTQAGAQVISFNAPTDQNEVFTPFPPEDYLFFGRLKSDRKYFSSGEN